MFNRTIRTATIWTFVAGLICTMTAAAIAEGTDIDDVKLAVKAYYQALSTRDLPAMERVWQRGPRAVNVAPPVRLAAHTGWDAIRKNYQMFWATLDRLTVSMPDPQIVVHGSTAWVYGIEHANRKSKDGKVGGGANFGTSIFVKEGGRWLMVFHEAALISGAK